MLSLLAKKVSISSCLVCRRISLGAYACSQEMENKYTKVQRERILQIINNTDTETLSSYNITKVKLKKIIDWRKTNGAIKTLSDIVLIDGFTEKYSIKLCDSILDGPQKTVKTFGTKIKGQILHPILPEAVRRNCQTVLAIYVTVSSVCWTLINRSNYKVVEWKYKPIQYPNSKGIKITDILNIAWEISCQLPTADVYVMKAEATSLRASGSDPNNPKVLGVNLQKAQLIAMLIAFINARSNGFSHLNADGEEANKQFRNMVYFLRSTLPYRLYGTLVGNERVSTDQAVEVLLQESKDNSRDNSQVCIPEYLKIMFRSKSELQKDMLGHCLLLALTFMDVCVFLNKESIEKLIRKGE